MATGIVEVFESEYENVKHSTIFGTSSRDKCYFEKATDSD